MQLRSNSHSAALIREHDEVESRSFLIGLGNGIWMSALLSVILYWFVQLI